MCRAVRCRTCGMVTWAGCGDHVDKALAGVAVEDRCPGHQPRDRALDAGSHSRVLGR